MGKRNSVSKPAYSDRISQIWSLGDISDEISGTQQSKIIAD
jgi:hypothetical protein